MVRRRADNTGPRSVWVPNPSIAIGTNLPFSQHPVLPASHQQDRRPPEPGELTVHSVLAWPPGTTTEVPFHALQLSETAPARR
jgi:hypothetical protein